MNKNLPTKKFVFEISIDAVPHTEYTCKEIYGGGYNPDFQEYSHAIDLIHTALQDAVTNCFMAQMKHMAKCKCDPEQMNEQDANFYNFLEAKVKNAERIRDSLKFVRAE